jgi:tRNA(Ile)-lysidine synthase
LVQREFWLKEKNIPWREDSSNKDDIFLRNKVRLRLIPFLNEFFPNWAKGLSVMAETQSLAAEFLTQETQRCISWEYISESYITCAENFFSQPRIIREEAVFLGVNLCVSSSVPKRSVIRRFCKGLITSADLGLVQIKHKNGKIALSPVQDKDCESGFSLLIKESGLYNLNNIRIEVCPASAQDGENSFIAALPLVFRQCFKDDIIENTGRKINKQGLKDNPIISVVDKQGIAAFIGSKGILAKRELPEPYNCNECSLIVVSNI